MEFCADCPRRDEMRGKGRSEVQGKSVGSAGPLNSQLLVVGMSPGKDELVVGRPFVGGAGRVLAAALAHANVSINSCRLVNVINCYPQGRNESISPTQFKACRDRFVSEVVQARPRCILALGGDALYATTGLEPISSWQGYLIEPFMMRGLKRGRETYTPCPVLCRVVPAFHPAAIMRLGLKPIEWLFRPVDRAVRESRSPITPWNPPINSVPAPSRVIGVDIETKGDEISLIGLAGEGWASNAPDLDVRGILGSLSLKVVQNLAFDKPRLERSGYPLEGMFWDTMLAQHLIDPDGIGFSLNEIAPYWLDCYRWKHEPGPRPRDIKLKTWKRDFRCKGCSASGDTGVGVKDLRICPLCANSALGGQVEAWELSHAVYNLKDVACLIPIQEQQERALRSTGQVELFERMMRVVAHVLIPLAARGLRVDPRARDKLVSFYQKKEDYATRHLAQWLGEEFSPYSNKHIHKLLYETWGLPVQYKKGVGNVTADEEAIHRLVDGVESNQQRKVLRGILRARGARKFWKTYGVIEERVYPRYSPTAKESDAGGKRTVAATGRILARGDRETGTPPIQQIPRSIRKLFLPEPGHLFVQGDWKQQELRLIGQFSGCTFINENLDRKPDLFDIIGARYKCDRVRAKNIFYGLWAYGGSARAGQHALGAKGFRITLKECEEIIADAKRLAPEIFTWHAGVYSQVRRDRSYRNPFGRVRRFPSPKDSYNECLNFPIQSTGADMLWAVLEDVDVTAREYGGELKILVHDSICCSIPEENAIAFGWWLERVMGREWSEIASGFSVPVDLKIGANWGEVS